MLINRNKRRSVVSKLASMAKGLDYRRPIIASPDALAPTLGAGPADYPIEDYRRGFRSGLEAGMRIGHSGGRGYEQVAVQQAIEAHIRAAENRGDAEAARVLRNLASQLPDPRRSLRVVS